MVGCGNRIDGGRSIPKYNEETVQKLIKDYKEKKKEQAIFGISDEKIVFLERCLNNIEPYEKDLITKIYIDGVSIRQYAKMSGFSRDAISKELKRIVSMLTKFFNIMRFEN